MTIRWYGLAIVALLSMNQALGSFFNPAYKAIKKIDEQIDQSIDKVTLLAIDQGAQVFEYLRPRWRECAIIGVVGLCIVQNVQHGRQIAQQGQQIVQQGQQIAALQGTQAFLDGQQVAQQGQRINLLEQSRDDLRRKITVGLLRVTSSIVALRQELTATDGNVAALRTETDGYVEAFRTDLNPLTEQAPWITARMHAHELNIRKQGMDLLKLCLVVSGLLNELRRSAQPTRSAQSTHRLLHGLHQGSQPVQSAQGLLTWIAPTN